MPGMDAFLTPSLVRAAAASVGLKTARLELEPKTQSLTLTIEQRGREIRIDVPIGRTFTRDEICDLLLGASHTGPAPP